MLRNVKDLQFIAFPLFVSVFVRSGFLPSLTLKILGKDFACLIDELSLLGYIPPVGFSSVFMSVW